MYLCNEIKIINKLKNIKVMKIKNLTFVLLMSGIFSIAQETNYNTWSVDVHAGLASNNGFVGRVDNYSGFINHGYNDFFPTDFPQFRFNPLHVNVGVRKNLSRSLSFRLGVNYTKMDNKKYSVTYTMGDLQGYLNLNQLTNSTIFKNRVNFLIHAGFGMGTFSYDDSVMSGVAGITTQLRLIDNLDLIFDASNTFYGKHQRNYDGTNMLQGDAGLIDASVMNLSAGLKFSFGKNEKHADWVTNEVEEAMKPKSNDSIVDVLNNKVSEYATLIDDLNKRIKDLESAPKVPNDTFDYKGKIKMLEDRINSTNYTTKQKMDANEMFAYFDFNIDYPKESSMGDIQTAIDYMKNNPSASMELVGFADKIGDDVYNENLSKRRVNNVKRIMTKAGIKASRLTTNWKGRSEASADDESQRALERKVVFRVK